MLRLAPLAIAALLLASNDVTHVSLWMPQPFPPRQIPPGESLPVLPELPQGSSQEPAAKPADRPLQPESRLAIIRYVSGEFARALQPLPTGKKGFRIKVGQPVDAKALRQAVANNGSAANPGDTVQITHIGFHGKELWIDINGGGKRRKRLRDRIQVTVSGMPRVATDAGPPGYQGVGSTLILDFGRPLPDMTPDQLKQFLSGMLDFSRQHSAAVQWVETLPPEFQQAIKDRKAAVGMSHDMVLAALGRPDHKVRSRDPDGTETEDWIYGQPPAKTVFVTFAGDKVIRVKQYP